MPLIRARPSFGPRVTGLRPAIASASCAGQGVAVERRLAVADHHGGHMGEGGEVARGADGALRGDDGRDARGQHLFQQGHDLPPHAGGAAAEGEELQRHHQAGDRAGHRIAHAAAMRQDQVALQGGGVLRAAILSEASLPKPVLTP